MALKRPVYHLHRRQIFSLHLRLARGNLASGTFLIMTFFPCSCRGTRVLFAPASCRSPILIPLRFEIPFRKKRKWKLVHHHKRVNKVVSSFFHASLFLQRGILESFYAFRINLFVRSITVGNGFNYRYICFAFLHLP